MDTTRRKVMCVAIVTALLSVAAIGVMSMPVAAKDTDLSIIAQVNQNGSQLIIRNSYCNDPNEYRTIKEDGTLDFEGKQSKWGGKVIGTPGPATIQHKMLEAMVLASIEDHGLNMKFEAYYEGCKFDSGTVYYQTGVNEYGKWQSSISTVPNFIGCIIWEYVASEIVMIKGEAKFVIDSKNMDANHACCVIAARESYLQNNWDSTVRFLKAYVKGVNDIKTLVEQTEVDENFAKWATNELGYDKDNEQHVKMVKNALKNVSYTYGDSTGDRLGYLRGCVTKFVMSDESLKAMILSQYNSIEEFSNQFINDKFLNDAIEDKETDKYDVKIKIATINYDIHQIALKWAMHKGYFTDNHIEVVTIGGSNGSDVALYLQNGEADIGFMGVPPITTKVANGKLNTPQYFELSGRIMDNGTPVSKATVVITPSYNVTYTCETNDDGYFSVKVIKGTYAVSTEYLIHVNTTYHAGTITNLSRVVADYDFGELEMIL